MIYDGRIQGTWSSHPEGMGWDGNDGGEVREAGPTARAQHAKSQGGFSGYVTYYTWVCVECKLPRWTTRRPNFSGQFMARQRR